MSRPSLKTNHSRRAFLRGLAGILAAGVAPAFIGSKILMPVKKLIVPETALFSGEVGSWENVKFIESGTGSYEVTMQFVIKALVDGDQDKLKSLVSGKWEHKDGGRIAIKA